MEICNERTETKLNNYSKRPEGSAATVENDVDMLFDVPGTYNVRLNLEYAGVLESVSYDVVISES